MYRNFTLVLGEALLQCTLLKTIFSCFLFISGYFIETSGTCASKITMHECKRWAVTHGSRFVRTVSEKKSPLGCFHILRAGVWFNTLSTTTTNCNTIRQCVCISGKHAQLYCGS